MSSKQFALITQRLKSLDENSKKLKTDLHNLMSICGTMTAELVMVKERLDIFCNQDFILQQFKKPTEKKE